MIPMRLGRAFPAIVLGLFVAGLAGAEIVRSHRSTLRSAENDVQRLAHVLSEQSARTFQAVDVTLEYLAARLSDDPALADNDPEFRSEMRERLRSMPYVRALFVVRPDGYISHDTDFPATPRVSLADRPYFETHEADPSVGLHIGHPLRSRSVGVWFVSASRRISQPNGDFGGIVVAAVEPLFFEDFYRPLLVGNGSIVLLRQDGVLIARSPNNNEAMGRSYASEALFREHLPSNEAGIYWTRSPIDEVNRVAAYQKLPDAPLVMLVTLNKDEVLRSWIAHLYVICSGTAAILAMLAFVEWLAVAYRQREQAALVRLQSAERLEAVGRFARGVAHDFGNIIRIVRSSLVTLRQAEGDQGSVEAAFVETERSLSAGLALVDSLLMHTRRRDPAPDLRLLDELVLNSLPLLVLAAGPICNIKTDLNGRGRILVVTHELEAVILNLVLNARDAMPGGGEIAIRTRILEPEQSIETVRRIELTIEDEGTGIPARIREQALDPFATTKDAEHNSGVGLSQVRTFAERNDASLSIADREAGGTVVRLLFVLRDQA